MKSWTLLALLGAVAGCATPPSSGVGSGNGRFLVLRDYGMAYAQMEAARPDVCAQLRSAYSKALVPGGSQHLDCENVDQSQTLPYSLSVSDASEPVLVTTFNRALCTSWEGRIKKLPGVKVQPRGCQERANPGAGKRFFQVQDTAGGVYAQADFGTQANCEQFDRVRASTSKQFQGSTRFVCTDASRSPQMQYTATVIGQDNLPMLEMETRDKGICEALAQSLAGQYPAYRPECKFKR